MKVIFLDIDGVLNYSKTFDIQNIDNKFCEIEIDRRKVEYLKRIIDNTDSKIVLSSSWRHFFYIEDGKVLPRTERGKLLKEVFDVYGIEIYDLTIEYCNEYKTRKDQIELYLNTHDVDNYVIIDDETSEFKGYMDNIIKTYFFEDEKGCGGLLESHIDLATNMLNNKVKKLTK